MHGLRLLHLRAVSYTHLFFCTPCVAREEVQRSAAGALLEKLFEGSAEKLFAALLGSKRLSKDELARLEAMVAAAQEEEQP